MERRRLIDPPLPLRKVRLERDQPAQQEIALQAIVTLARKPQNLERRAALRVLIREFNSAFSLDF